MTWKKPTPEQQQEAREARKQANMDALCAPSTGKIHVGRYGGEVRPMAGQPMTGKAVVKQMRRVLSTLAEIQHMRRVKTLPCVLCTVLGLTQDSITDVHHIREGQGGAQRASDWLTVALCHDGCHQGPHGIHGDRARLRQAKCTELDLLAMTLAALDQASNERKP